jgi:3-deoxy-D-manno-octulosonic-acid transferase
MAARWKPKARLWVRGRRLFPQLNRATGPTVWMHCASLGEFEQGRPLLENIRKHYPGARIVLSFFSPSGYEIQKNYTGADFIFYLPTDGPAHAKKLLDTLQPSLVLWVKYEFWYYYLNEIKKRNIPLLMVSGLFRPQQPFFKWYGKVWRSMLGCFTHFFVQNDQSLQLLNRLHFVNASICGDTRFDRVITIAESAGPLPLVESFCGNSRVIVAGSTWEDDEAEWVHYVKANPDIRFIIAPHEVDAANIADVQKEFTGSILYSELEKNTVTNANAHVLIIDNIGMLARLYRYAHIAYVGGGFDAGGIHNVLEAAVYGRPVLFGPNYEKFAEAVELVELCAAISISSALQLEQQLTALWNDAAALRQKSDAAKRYVYAKAGATKKLMDYIQAKRLLTN